MIEGGRDRYAGPSGPGEVRVVRAGPAWARERGQPLEVRMDPGEERAAGRGGTLFVIWKWGGGGIGLEERVAVRRRGIQGPRGWVVSGGEAGGGWGGGSGTRRPVSVAGNQRRKARQVS